MVTPARAPLRTHRLRALNTPESVVVDVDKHGVPEKIGSRDSGLGARKVTAVSEQWRIDDEWWRQPIVRRYWEVVVENGGRVVLFENLMTGEWFEQMP